MKGGLTPFFQSQKATHIASTTLLYHRPGLRHVCGPSRVDYQLDLAQRADDHFPVIVDLRLALSGGKGPSSATLAWTRGDSDKLKQLAPQCVDAHATQVTQQLQFLQEKVFPRVKRAPKKPFVSATSWQLILRRNSNRKRLQSLDEDERLVRLKRIFELWRTFPRDTRAAQVSFTLQPTLFTVQAAKASLCFQQKGLCKQLRKALAQDRWTTLRRWLVDVLMPSMKMIHVEPIRPCRSLGKAPAMLSVKRKAMPKLELENGTLAQTAQEKADRWLQFFSEVESAEPIPRELLTILADEQQRPDQDHVICCEGACVPTLLDWEAAMRKGKPGKHPGPDGIRQELCRLHVPTVSAVSYALFLKVSLCGQEPLRFKGGLLTALYKGRGDHSKCSNSRSILLSDTLGKKWHSCLRRQALPFVQGQLRPEQAGAVPERTLDAAAMAIRAPAMLAQARKRAAAIVFLDVKSAFYTVFRPLLLGHEDNEDKFMYALRALRIPPIYFQCCRDIAEDKPLAAKAGMPAALTHQLLQTLQHSWFATQGSTEVAYSMAGTRPGEPRDLLFVPLCADVLHTVHTALRAEGLVTPDTAPDEDPCLITPAWVDDVAFFQWAACPEELMQRVRALCRIAHDSFGKKGLILNNAKGKSMCMPMLRGARAKAIRVFQEQHWDSGVAYSCMTGVQQMPFTKSYKHLGSIMDFSLSLLSDVKMRMASMPAEMMALRRPIFPNPKVPLRIRALLLKTLVVSKGMHVVGTWRELGVIEAKAWRDGIAHAYQALRFDRQELEQAGRGLHTLCQRLSLPHPDALVSLARIRLYAQLVESADGCTRAILAKDCSDNSLRTQAAGVCLKKRWKCTV